MSKKPDSKADQLAALQAASDRLGTIRNESHKATLRSEFERLDRRVAIACRLDELFSEARTLLDELARLDVESWSDLSSSGLPKGLNTTRRAKNRASCVVAHLGELDFFFEGAKVHGLHNFTALAEAYLAELERATNSATAQEVDEDAA